MLKKHIIEDPIYDTVLSVLVPLVTWMAIAWLFMSVI